MFSGRALSPAGTHSILRSAITVLRKLFYLGILTPSGASWLRSFTVLFTKPTDAPNYTPCYGGKTRKNTSSDRGATSSIMLDIWRYPGNITALSGSHLVRTLCKLRLNATWQQFDCIIAIGTSWEISVTLRCGCPSLVLPPTLLHSWSRQRDLITSLPLYYMQLWKTS